ncbi:MAG: beta-N-acetylhexosaminidase [Tannerella sp.]|jgi:hexosaminidase|nr:beta-N-acetylhexosaminidase [Tannerella sp.]
MADSSVACGTVIRIKKNVLIVLLLVLFAEAASSQVSLFPSPAGYDSGKGVFNVNENTVFDGTDAYAAKLASDLQERVKAENIRPAGGADAGEVRLTLTAAGAKSAKMEKDAYTIHIFPGGVRMEASSESGLFYAKETLLQLIRFHGGALPVCRIEDSPRYEWRGFMLDESRHFFGREKVKQYLDIMASLRMNVFHWHLTDEPGWRIEIKRYPELTSVGARGNYHDPDAPAAFYTQEEIREIVAYAAERHIMVVPEFDMPGHATAVCRAYPEISGGGEGRWRHFTFHPCRDETYDFIGHVLDEIVALFPSPYIHLGGDEVHYGNRSWFDDAGIQQFIKEKDLKNETGLEHYFIRRVADTVASKGRTVIGWDEIVDAGLSPSKAVVMWWRHDRKDQLVKALEQGFRVIMTPRRPLYGDFVQYGSHRTGRFWNGYNTLEDIYRFPEPVAHLMKDFEDRIMGLQMSVWTERIGDGKRLDYMVFPRLAAVAEAAWTPARSKECSLFMQKLPLFLEYLDSLNIYYFNPFSPDARPEPGEPGKKEDILQNG